MKNLGEATLIKKKKIENKIFLIYTCKEIRMGSYMTKRLPNI